MNKDRRKKIEKLREQLGEIKNAIEELQQEEQDSADNMPESMHGNDRHSATEEAVSALEDAASAVDDVDGPLETAMGG